MCLRHRHILYEQVDQKMRENILRNMFYTCSKNRKLQTNIAANRLAGTFYLFEEGEQAWYEVKLGVSDTPHRLPSDKVKHQKLINWYRVRLSSHFYVQLTQI